MTPLPEERRADAPDDGDVPLAPTALDDVDPEAVRRAALSSPYVVALHPGEHGEAATYQVDGRVVGVQVREDSVVVHVVGRWGSTVQELAADVRRTVSPKARGRRVDIVLADITLPLDDTATDRATPAGDV